MESNNYQPRTQYSQHHGQVSRAPGNGGFVSQNPNKIRDAERFKKAALEFAEYYAANQSSSDDDETTEYFEPGQEQQLAIEGSSQDPKN